MTTRVDEIAPELFRISTYVPDFDLQFGQFLLRDEAPLLWQTGMRAIFPEVREAVARVVDPAALAWIGFSHYEPDECGALNDWLELAPGAQAFCSPVGAMVFANDAALRPVRGLGPDETIDTGRRRLRLLPTPHLPHGWDAAMLFEETERSLLCSDLFHQQGDVEALTESDVVGRFRETLRAYQATPLADYMPYTPKTEARLRELAALRPALCATMHGSAFRGDGGRALLELGTAMREELGGG